MKALRWDGIGMWQTEPKQHIKKPENETSNLNGTIKKPFHPSFQMVNG
jgi:hypothetical protein